jgi:DNA 3'-phosphatase
MLSGNKRPRPASEVNGDDVVEIDAGRTAAKKSKFEPSRPKALELHLPSLSHPHFCVPVHFPLRGLKGDDTGVLRVPKGFLHETMPPAGVWFTTSGDPAHRNSITAALSSDSSAAVRTFDVELGKPFWRGPTSREPSSSSSAASSTSALAHPSIKGSDISFENWPKNIVNRFTHMTPKDWGSGLHFYATEGWHPLPPITKKGIVAADADDPTSRRVKILALDVDHTLIKPRDAKATFCEGSEDWQWNYSNGEAMVIRIADYYSRGYGIVLFSNQLGVSASQGKSDLGTVRRRFEAISRRFNETLKSINEKKRASGQEELTSKEVPMLIMMACEDDLYRKPRVGFFFVLQSYCCNGVPIDCPSSLFVADSCGRVFFESSSSAATKLESDKRASDLQFALNLGLPFATPEAFFLGTRGPGAQAAPGAAAAGASSSLSSSSAVPAGATSSAPKGGAAMMASFFGVKTAPSSTTASTGTTNTSVLRDWDPLSLPMLRGSKEDAKAQAKQAGKPAPSGTMVKFEHGFLPSLMMHPGPKATTSDAEEEEEEVSVGGNGGGDEAPSIVVPFAKVDREKACDPTLRRLDGINRPIDVPPPRTSEGVASGSSNDAGDGPEMVLLVGVPASGKSSLVASCFPRHRRINQDSIGTREACVKATRDSIVTHGVSVVIDATNITPMVRKGWQQLAHYLKVPIRAVVIFANDRSVDSLTPYSIIGKGALGKPSSSSSSASMSDSYSSFLPYQGTDPGPDRRLLKATMFHLNELRRVSPLGTADGGAFDRRSVPGHVLHSFAQQIIAPTPLEIKGSAGSSSSSSAAGDVDADDSPCAPFTEVIPVRFVPAFSYGLKKVKVGSEEEKQLGLDPEAEAFLFARNLLFSFVADSASRSYAPPINSGGSGAGGGGGAGKKR